MSSRASRTRGWSSTRAWRPTTARPTGPSTRPTTTTHVRGPLLALLEELAPEFGTAKVFRPYRDVRFSHDKTPYKTHQGAVVHADGPGAGAWYVQISADGLRVSGGCWRLESDQVDRYRRAVADDVQGPRLQAEVDRLSGGRLRHRRRDAHPGAGRLPRGPPRGWSCCGTSRCTRPGRWEPADWLHERRALDEVRDAWRRLRTLNTWLADNVGATTKEPRPRR